MPLRTYLSQLKDQNQLLTVDKPISSEFEIAGFLKKVEPRPVLFTQVEGSQFPVLGNLFCSKASFASYFGITVRDIIPLLSRAIDQRAPSHQVSDAPCQQVIELNPNLDHLPILRHCQKDGGRYISAGIFIIRHPRYGQNVDFHRCMQISPHQMAVRVVKNRHFDLYLQELGVLDVAICLGNAPNVLAAAATSVDLGINELDIANALEPVPVVKARTLDLWVPADAEIVIEGRVYRDCTHPEGPFVDLTETYDVIRNQPIFEVQAITHRHDAIWQALLPGALEHKLLMGMPREPTIYQKVNQVTRCLDVNVNPGGCSWLHAIVQIDKQHENDGRKAIAATFEGHRSCKHVYVVDADIDIYDPLQVEWALATRFQADRDLIILPAAPGSSLDPSAEPGTHQTHRLGFDLTKPLNVVGKSFERASFPQVDPDRWLKA